MPRRVYDFIREPSGDILRRLMLALSAHASFVLMVLRDDLEELNESGKALLSRITPHLEGRRRSASWPGTTLFGAEATTLRFFLNEAVCAELISASDGLYGWQQPKLPEDPALLRDDETVVLGSICHEHDAFMELTDSEFQDLVRAVPELAAIVKPQVAG